MFLNISQISQENICAEVSFNKVAGLKACNFKNKLQHRCFPVKLAKFLGTPFLENTSGGCLHNVMLLVGVPLTNSYFIKILAWWTASQQYFSRQLFWKFGGTLHKAAIIQLIKVDPTTYLCAKTFWNFRNNYFQNRYSTQRCI